MWDNLDEFLNAVNLAKSAGIEVCVHYILDLPWDSFEDVINGAKLLTKMGIDQVKCHSLYILKETKLGEMYEKGEVLPLSMDDYINRCIAFLENLNNKIVVQRLIGRAPEERSLFCSWSAPFRPIPLRHTCMM